MLKQMLIAALLCGAVAAPVQAQKTRWSLGFSIANAHLPHPFENPPEPGSSSGVTGAYGGILEKDYQVRRYAAEGFVQFSLRPTTQLRLRAGYAQRETAFASVYGSADQTPVNRNTNRETARNWHLAPAFIATHVLGRFFLHAGAEIPFYFLKPLETHYTWTDLTPAAGESSESWRRYPGGTSLGIGPVAGFSFQLDRRLFAGLEARGAWMYTRLQGNFEERSNWSGPLVSQTGTAETYRSSGLSNIQLALQLRFLL